MRSRRFRGGPRHSSSQAGEWDNGWTERFLAWQQYRKGNALAEWNWSHPLPLVVLVPG